MDDLPAIQTLRDIESNTHIIQCIKCIAEHGTQPPSADIEVDFNYIKIWCMNAERVIKHWALAICI